MQRVRVIILCSLLLFVVASAGAQGPILFFPVIFKGGSMTLKNTIGIVSPYGNQNYVLNPSGETTGNHSNQGSGTVTRVTTFQKYGLYAYQVAITASAGGGNFTLLSLSNASNYVSFRVKKSEALRLNVTIGSATKEARLLEKIDNEWSLYWTVFSAAQSSGQTNLRITQIGGGSNTIYLDGLQVEPNKLTSYIDGSQEGCGWLGAPHASASERSGDSRAGGEVKDFYEGYNFFSEKILGGGAAVEDLNIDSYAFLPGGELNSSKIKPREFSIIGFFLGNSEEELHEKVQALELELGLNTYPGQQPVRLRYSGARVQKEISASYAGGLEGDLPIYHNDDWSVEDEKWVRNYKFKMRASIQFIAIDPFWYEIGESVTTLDTNDSATFRVVAARLRSTGQWSSLGPPGTGGSASYTDVQAIVEDDTYIYVGGNFTNFDGIANADRIARYNKQTGAWSALGTGMDDQVFALALGPDGTLYAGGAFTTAGGTAASKIASWNGSAWAALGSGLNNPCTTIIVGPDGLLYVGGTFTTAGGGAANRVASWDGSAWAALGTGMDGTVSKLVFGLDGTLYAGGFFDNADGSPAAHIASWNGSAWAALGSGMNNNFVTALAIGPDGVLYAGGDFTTAGGISARRVASWNGSAWFALGTGMNASVYTLRVGPDNKLYAGGNFTDAGGVTLSDRVASWNGYTWSHLDIDLPGTPIVYNIATSKNSDPVSKNYSLYLGFDTTGTGNFAGSATASNGGTTSAFPKIIFARSGGTTATIQTLKNERTGRELLFNYSLLDGETLTVDLNPKARSITSSFFGPRMDAVLANSDFSVWQLLPGANQVTAFVSESGSPTVTAYLLYRDTYRSYN
jgi:hypothetical protein